VLCASPSKIVYLFTSNAFKPRQYGHSPPHQISILLVK
jgi:hypothetical protein